MADALEDAQFEAVGSSLAISDDAGAVLFDATTDMEAESTGGRLEAGLRLPLPRSTYAIEVLADHGEWEGSVEVDGEIETVMLVLIRLRRMDSVRESPASR